MAAILRAAVNMARRGIVRFRSADMSGVSDGVKHAHHPPAPVQSGYNASYFDVAFCLLCGCAMGRKIGDAPIKERETVVDDSELQKC